MTEEEHRPRLHSSIRHAICAGNKPRLKGSCGRVCVTDRLLTSSSAVNIPSALTSWISTVRPASRLAGRLPAGCGDRRRFTPEPVDV